jgi:hypothetical protein
MEGLTRRYPSQDQEGSIEEYHKDYKQLAIRHGIGAVAEAITKLRLDPEQKFFPRPDEIADQIRYEKRKSLPSHLYARG